MGDKKKLISIIIPCFNEEESILYSYQTIKKIIAQIHGFNFEIIFIDNGSEDSSANLMLRLAKKDSIVSAVLLSRNFGPESSGLAGLHQAKGDAIIIIAADLQDPPELIPQFIEEWQKGNEMVLGLVTSTEDSFLMLWLRKMFYKILRGVSYIDIPVNVTGFGLIDKKVNDAVKMLDEKNRFHRGFLAWVGFKKKFIPYKRSQRKYGHSSYVSLYQYIKHAEKGLFAFTNLPLDILVFVGLILVCLSVIAIVLYGIIFFVMGNPITGSATLLLGIMFYGGINLLAVSIVGKYIAIMFEETKNRPHYIIKKLVNRHSS